MAGQDPTLGWRRALAASTARQYRAPVPPAMPAAFVLQWTLEVPATVGAYAAVLGPWQADLAPAALSFDLAPGQHHPGHVQVRAAGRAAGGRNTRLQAAGDRNTRLQAARAAYQELARPFAAHYSPGVRLGPHQRQAMVDDVWASAVHRALQSLTGRPVTQPERGSCCFIYTLPGTHECAGCPRLRRSPAAVSR